jgi:UTP--glucose-1-phosphate uridylyltransferase
MLVKMKAVIPAAGWGLRFLPLTKEQPKEMLPVVDKPAIQYVVEEAIAAGIEDIIIITGRHKRSIEDHFDHSFELEELLKRTNRIDYLEQIRSLANIANIQFIRQKEQKGLGDAVLRAKRYIGNEAFAIMLGDSINTSSVPVVKQLMNVYDEKKRSVIAIEPLPREKLHEHGIIKGKRETGRLWAIDDLVEKPSAETAPSNMGISGTYIVTPGIFECIEQTDPGINNEVQLTDALRLLRTREEIYGFQFEGRRYDVGDVPGWLKTQFAIAMMNPVYSKTLRPFIEGILKDLD